MKQANRNIGPTFEARVRARQFEDLQLVVPKAVADQFRQVAKKSKITTSALFEEMVATYAKGMGVDEAKISED